MSTTTASLSTAEKARRKAEARRLRILAKGKERFDVVNGLAPSDIIKNDNNNAATSPPVTPVASSPTAAADVVQPKVETVDSTDNSVNSADERKAKADARMEATSQSAEGGTQSKGARRMAAMRKRRYQSKNKATAAAAMADKNEVVNDAEVERVVEKSEPSVANNGNDDEPTEEVDEKATTVPGSPLSIATEKNDEEHIPSPNKSVDAPPPVLHADEARDEVDEPQKKYMGVARMRRKRIKEQKAQRLKEIADAEVLTGTPSKSGSVDIQRELVAEIATMGITASMVRKGGLVDGVGGGSKGNSLSGIAMKKYGRKWWSVLIPPMKLVPRIVTLLLLFFAGLDLGMQPHRAAPSPFGNDMVARRDLAGVPNVESLIQHVEPSLTKPWEYGLGGKVAYAVGMAPSSPPTALPTSFDIGSLDCVAENEGTEECVAPKDIKMNSDNTGSKKKSSIKMQLMEDEFDSSRTRPKGVDHHNDNAEDASEFDDVDATTNKAPNIDPLFQVDLDSLLETASLPLPIDYAAKFAIGFHRTWLYYLWTLPTSIMKSLFNVPKNVFTGWIENPPWILGVVLTIRLLIRIVVGNGKSSAFSLDNSEDNSESSSGGGKNNNLDVLGKGIDMAKNYVTSKFPKAVLVGGTLMQVMKVDMYVVLCGLLIGLVLPSIKEDHLKGTSRPVLGDGEL